MARLRRPAASRKPASAPVSAQPKPAASFPREATSEDRSRILSQRYIDLAAASAYAASRGPRPEILNPFRFSDPPPGVLPEGVKPAISQNKLANAVNKWAMDQRLAQDEQQINFIPALGFANYGAALANGYGFLGYSFLSELAQVPEYRVISETIASEMTREGIEFKTATHTDRRKWPKDKAVKVEAIEQEFLDLSIMERCREVVEIDGFMGRGHLYLDTGDTDRRDELKLPIGDGKNDLSRRKVNRKNPLRAVRAIEATWCYPTDYNSDNPLRPDWYKPSQWFVMAQQLHVSRLLLVVGRDVPDILKPAYNFGGLALSQMAKPYVDNWLRTRQAVADLVWSFSTNVLKTDMQTLLQDASSAQSLLNRVLAFNTIRNNQGTLVINKDSEDWSNVAAPLAGLHELQAQAQEHMAAVSRIPLVKLLGIQPSGLNASSEGEIRVFYDSIAAFQKKLLLKPLTTILNFIQLSLFDEVDPEITFEFKPLWQLDDAASAAVQQTKATTRETDIASGTISPEEGRQAIAADRDSQYSGLDLEDTPAPGEMQELEDPYGELDTEAGEQPDNEEEALGGPKPKGSRLGSAITSKAAEFGSPVTGGFAA